MSGKTAKFLIAENPMAMPDRVHVVHTRFPRFIALLQDDLESFEMIWIEQNDLSADKLAKLMRRMGDWYRAYCEWEDQQ